MTLMSVLRCAALMSLLAVSTVHAEDVLPRRDPARIDVLTLAVPGLAPDGLRVRVFLPEDYDPTSKIGYPVLYLNDGQDAEAVALQRTRSMIGRGESGRRSQVAIDMRKRVGRLRVFRSREQRSWSRRRGMRVGHRRTVFRGVRRVWCRPPMRLPPRARAGRADLAVAGRPTH